MMSSFVPRASLSVRRGELGTTLVELLVVLAILSILAAIAVPFAETTTLRGKEQDLRATLRDTRDALDRMHADWREGVFEEDNDDISENGFPVDLSLLVEGLTDEDGATKRYLRKLPENPFAKRGAPFEDQWLLLGYADPPDARFWNGEDVYDLRPVTERIALDGSKIADW